MIRVQKFQTENIPLLISWVDSPETLMNYAGPALKYPLTDNQILETLKDKDRYAFQLMLQDVMIGYGEVFSLQKNAYLARIIIGEIQNRNKGYGREFIKYLIGFCKNTLGHHQVALNVFEENKNAITCYQKLGFEFVPEKRLERVVNGKTIWAVNMQLNL